MKILIAFLISGSVVLGALSFNRPANEVEILFHGQMAGMVEKLKSLHEATGRGEKAETLKTMFLDARLAYKRASTMVDYFFPTLRKSVNGPDLRYAEDDNPDVINDPHGFQVMERIIYDEEIDFGALASEISALVESAESMNGAPGLDYKLRPELMFDAMKASVIRIVSLGVTGFDSPIALQSLKETEAVLMGIGEILVIYKDDEGVALVERAKQSLGSAKTFDSFDRLQFMKSYADPLYSHLVKIVRSRGVALPVERRPLNQFTASLFSDTLFDVHFFSPNERYRMTADRVALGEALFYDTILSRAKRSCATCHQPGKGFTDGARVPPAINQSTELKRNTPSLTAVAFQTKFFYDSRAATLENQLNSVIHNIDEMDGSMKESIERIREHPVYHDQFKKAYPNERIAVTEYNIANAISSYMRSLPVFNTRFDKYMRGEGKLNAEEKKGFNLFAGKAKCATCHFVPLFNGLVPPQFTETESEVLGVPSVGSASAVDDDLGKNIFTRSEINKHAFKTPSLRNVSKTAPYMHNGVFRNLEEVMEFYNKGGGSGLGIFLDNQTLPGDSLFLSKKEIKSVIAFLGALDN